MREAACLVVQELIVKVAAANPGQFLPHVSNILSCLLECFKDMSWPVRDSACISCAHVFQLFHDSIVDHVSTEQMEAFYLLFEDHLSDNIQSVRINAAYAVGMLYNAGIYKDRLEKHIHTHILSVKEQSRADEKDGDE